ncbi:MAG: hypothetical protein E7812_17940 [Phenylobacterium sp.]|nr:MAG: hypothetical protein E7812_17940 [Phenylobacterium sp.]
MLGRGHIAPLLPAALALTLGACDDQGDAARLTARQALLDPARLWQAQEVVGRGIVMRTVRICADQKLRDSFQRAEPEVNAEPCRTLGPVVTRPGLYALRCRAEGHRFGVTVTTRGDTDRAFEVSYAVTPLDLERGPFVQTVRYRLLGTCPAGWRIGDQAEVDAAGAPMPPGTADPNAAGAKPGAVPGLPS